MTQTHGHSDLKGAGINKTSLIQTRWRPRQGYPMVSILTSTPLYCIALYCTSLLCTALNCTALHCTDMNHAALHSSFCTLYIVHFGHYSKMHSANLYCITLYTILALTCFLKLVACFHNIHISSVNVACLQLKEDAVQSSVRMYQVSSPLHDLQVELLGQGRGTSAIKLHCQSNTTRKVTVIYKV